MQTLTDIADGLRVSVQTVRNKISRYERVEGVKFFESGRKSRSDLRRIEYPDEIVEGFMRWHGQEPIAPVVSVEAGNHYQVIESPAPVGTFSLDRWRSSQSMSIEDPTQVAAQVGNLLENIESAMRQDILTRENRLNETRLAAEKVTAKKQRFALEARIYEERARAIDAAQVLETERLIRDSQELQDFAN